MCLDIDPGSVIHKHLVKKINELTKHEPANFEKYDDYIETYSNPIIKPEAKNLIYYTDSKHSLTMLPSFHISLGAPPPNSQIKTESVNIHKPQLHELIGIITLADINVSENRNKKSAWISIDDSKFILAHQIHDFSFLNSEDLHLHISVANLTGDPHDSIARPEDCIIDTITA